MASRRPSKKQAGKGAIPRRINLSEQEGFTISLANHLGKEVASIHFDRESEEQPQLKVNLIGASGKLQSSLVVFDIDAPRS